MNNSQAGKIRNERPIIIVTASFLIVAMICAIVNYSVNQSISWSLIPIGGLTMLWAMILPLLFMKNNKSLGLFAGLAITLVPYLFLIQSQTSTKGWVVPLALPIALLVLAALGLSLLAFRYIKSNKLYPVALTIFLFGVIANFGTGIILNSFLDGYNIDDIPRVFTMSVSALLSVMFVIAGYLQENNTREQEMHLQ